MLKVHLDTDIGGDPDDLCALAMLLKWPDLQITGITTVSDNQGKRAGYAKYVLQIANREDIPVKAGTDASRDFYRTYCGLPDEKDYWPEPVAPVFNPVDEALELLKKSIEQEAIIIGIGPYTNLFLLDKKYPGILQKAKIFLMGGYVYPVREDYPQWGNDMDWNIQVDVNSAKYVLENSDPTLIPLTVTVETAVRRAYLPALRQSGKLGQIIAAQVEALDREHNNEEKFGKTCSGLPGDILNFQHDPLACAVALSWNEGVVIEDIPLKFEIRDGWLYEEIDPKGKKTKLLTKINNNAFNDFWYKIITSQ